MPALEDLEQFKAVLNTLGNEPAILEERGDKIEDVPPPEQGLPDDLSALLDTGIEPEEQPGLDNLDEFPDTDAGDLDSLPDDDFTGIDLAGLGEPEAGDESFEEPTAPEITEEEMPSAEMPLDLGEPVFTEPPEETFDGGEDIDELLQGFGDIEDEEDVELDSVDEAGGFDLAEEEPDTFDESFAGPPGETEPVDEGLPGPVPEGFDDDFEFPDISADLDELTDEPETPAAVPESAIPEEDVEDFGFALDEAAADEPGAEEEEPFPLGFGEEETFGEAGDLGEPEEDTSDFSMPDEDVESLPKSDQFKLPDEYEVTEDISGDKGFSAEGFDEGGFDVKPFEDETSGFGEGEDFSLGDLDEEMDKVKTPVPAAEEEELSGGDLEGAEDDLKISDEDFMAVQRTLGNLPRNLKLPIEELIGEKNLSGKDLKKMLGLLITGAGTAEIAAFTGRLIGKKIQIPDQYMKRTGLEFEEETASFIYLFKTRIFPVLKIAFLAVAVTGVLAFIGYRFIYKPLYAESLYRKGYTEIENDRYPAANEYFRQAWKVREKKSWFLTYAQGYVKKNQFAEAETKFQELLKLYDDYPNPRKNNVRTVRPKDALYKQAMLGYADMESALLSDYGKAEALLNTLLDQMMYDRDALFMQADNYLRWGEEDMQKYNSAGDVLKVVTEKHGGTQEVLYRLLTLYIKTDNEPYVMATMKTLRSLNRLKVEPIAFADLAGYLIGKDHIDDVNNILSQALDADNTVPEVFYNFAKFYRRIENPQKEETALKDALKLLENLYPISKPRRKILIDTYNRLGLLKYGQEEYITAEDYFQKAITSYEDQKNRGEINPAEEFGLIYANLGDLYFYVSNNYDAALELYLRAQGNMYDSADLQYKKGFIYYADNDYSRALDEFYSSAGIYSNNPNLMFSMANTLFSRNDFFAAEGYYAQLLDKLEQQLRGIPFLEPAARPEHKALVENIIKTYNNIGVTRYFLSQRSDDRGKYSEALVDLSKSSELAENLGRDPEELTRPQSRNLALLNSRAVMYPASDFEPQIFKGIPKDREWLAF
ncbi:MAG: tetratricopeptide repeat protein [Spirochaetales bacterium]|nr:MAG: tetratricopeptide repeat protein [Spirochaetales bacterium]